MKPRRASQRDQAAKDAMDPFPRITYGCLLAYTVRTSDHLAGTGFLRRGAGTLLTGGTGIGKSVLAEQIAVEVAGGVPLVGCIRVSSPHRVLYCAAENDEETLKRDILSITRHAPGKPCPLLVERNLYLHHVYGLSGTEFARWLRNRVQRDRPDLVVIDPYQQFIGGVDINHSATFLQWIRPIESIVKSYACALLIVCHTTKPQDRAAWTARESVYMAAGSSVISNWARCSAELTHDGRHDERYRLRFGKNAERTGLTNEQGQIVRDLYIEHSGKILEPFWRPCPDQHPTIVIGKYDLAIMNVIKANPAVSSASIAKQVNCPPSTVLRARRRLSA